MYFLLIYIQEFIILLLTPRREDSMEKNPQRSPKSL